MPVFAFEARDDGGRLHAGEREAPDASSLARDLAGSGLTPLKIGDAQSTRQKTEFRVSLPQFGKKVALDELVIFAHQMSTLTRSGISVARAIRGLSESAKNPHLGEVLAEIADALEGGMDVATCLKQHPRVFSELFVSVVHVGENTGRLDNAFERIAKYLEFERETKKRIAAATRYPTFVVVAIAIAIAILNIFVIPAFAKVFDKFGAALPWQTQLILTISDFFVAWWPLMLVCLCAGAYGVVRYLKTYQGRYRWDKYKLRLPLIGSLFERITLSRFCQTFAMVVRAGLPITLGLHVVARAIGNEFMAARVLGMRTGIERGESITQTASESGMFTPVVLQMIAVGEEVGAIDDLLDQCGGFYEEEVDYELKSLTDAIEPLLIGAIGVMVLVLALGVFLPLWDLSTVALK